MSDFKLAYCGSCGDPIIWTVTQKGKPMPLDADPVAAPRGFRLDVDVLDDDRKTPVAMFTAKPDAGEKLYIAHFATCEHADQHRR